MAFHERCCRYPDVTTMKEARSHLSGLVYDLCNDMKKRDVTTCVHFQGSSYEGIKTLASPLEFDCLIVLGGRAFKAPDDCPAGYTKLKPNGQGLSIKKLCEGDFLSPQKIRAKFESELQKSINNLRRPFKMVLVKHGPALQIDVYRDWGGYWYSVDMVPGFHVRVRNDYHVYVAKPYKPLSYGFSSEDAHLSWRRSYSIEEKLKFKNIDRDNGCRKMVVRMVKVMREIDSPLSALPSYMIKTAVMNLDRDRDLDWHQRCLGLRFVDVLSYLSTHLSLGHLPHHFLDGSSGLEPLNLLSDIDEEVLNNMAGRLKNLLNSKAKMTAMLNKTLPGNKFCKSKSSNRIITGYPEEAWGGYNSRNFDNQEQEAVIDDRPNFGYHHRHAEGSGFSGASVAGVALLGLAAAGVIGLGLLASEREERKKRIDSGGAHQAPTGRRNKTSEGMTAGGLAGGFVAAGIGAVLGGIATLGIYALSGDGAS